MGRPSTPTGRAKVFRVSLFCHTGFELDRQFLSYTDSCRRSLRQEYFRRYLSVGYLLGYQQIESVAPPSSGRIRRIRIIILADDPILCTFLDEYRLRSTCDGKERWVRETILAGYRFFSGNAVFKGTGSRQESPGESGSGDPKKLLGGLFDE
ncbi:MAG: hypothetical protein ACYCYP_12325 [Leptospirales bacterium]